MMHHIMEYPNDAIQYDRYRNVDFTLQFKLLLFLQKKMSHQAARCWIFIRNSLAVRAKRWARR